LNFTCKIIAFFFISFTFVYSFFAITLYKIKNDRLKNVFVIIFLLHSIIQVLLPQNLIYYDVLELTKCLDRDKKFNSSETSRFSSLPILKKYYLSVDSGQNMFQYFRKNPFLNDFIPPGNGISNAKLNLIQPRNYIPTGYKDIAFTAEHTPGHLMAGRYSERFTIEFYIRFKSDFQKYPELKTLYPKTFEVLEMTNPDEFYNMFPILRDAFTRDLNKFLLRLPLLRLQAKYADALRTPEGKVFVVASSILSGIQQGKNIAELFAEMCDEKAFKKDTCNLFRTVQYINLISSGFRDTSSDNIWITPTQMRVLFNNETKLKLFSGLIYERNKVLRISFFREGKEYFNLQKQLESISSQPSLSESPWLNYLRECYKNLSAFEQQFDELKLKNNKKYLDDVDCDAYTGSVTSFIENILQFNQVYTSAFVPDDVKSLFPVLKTINSSFQGFNSGRYGSAMFDVLQVLDSTLFHNGQNSDSKNAIKTYGVFIANICEAQNSEGIKLAIESVINPPKVSSLKTYSKWSVALNMYAGVYVGNEILRTNYESIITAGTSFPIGIGIYYGIRDTKKIFGNYGLFFTIVDIGVYSSFNLDNNSASRLPEMELKNLIIPGVTLVAGRLFDSPLSLGLGVMYGPQVRITEKNNNSKYTESWRYSFSIYYDIPLRYFYNK
jgi:hypothetical protein